MIIEMIREKPNPPFAPELATPEIALECALESPRKLSLTQVHSKAFKAILK